MQTGSISHIHEFEHSQIINGGPIAEDAMCVPRNTAVKGGIPCRYCGRRELTPNRHATHQTRCPLNQNAHALQIKEDAAVYQMANWAMRWGVTVSSSTLHVDEGLAPHIVAWDHISIIPRP